MYAETLDMAEGLPERFEEYSAVVFPEGKRCLAVVESTGTLADGGRPNTSLLSRVSGRTLTRVSTPLPFDSYLDAVWDEENGMLWLVDLVRWRGQWFVDCDAELRCVCLRTMQQHR